MTETKFTKAEAIAQGYQVQEHRYPWLGHKGSCLHPREQVDVLTDLESELYEALEGVTTELSAIMDMAPGNRHNAEVFDKIDVALTALSKARGEAS